MAEWLKATDCKSVEIFLRRFESCLSHSLFRFRVFLLSSFKFDNLKNKTESKKGLAKSDTECKRIPLNNKTEKNFANYEIICKKRLIREQDQKLK